MIEDKKNPYDANWEFRHGGPTGCKGDTVTRSPWHSDASHSEHDYYCERCKLRLCFEDVEILPKLVPVVGPIGGYQTENYLENHPHLARVFDRVSKTGDMPEGVLEPLKSLLSSSPSYRPLFSLRDVWDIVAGVERCRSADDPQVDLTLLAILQVSAGFGIDKRAAEVRAEASRAGGIQHPRATAVDELLVQAARDAKHETATVELLFGPDTVTLRNNSEVAAAELFASLHAKEHANGVPGLSSLTDEAGNPLRHVKCHHAINRTPRSAAVAHSKKPSDHEYLCSACEKVPQEEVEVYLNSHGCLGWFRYQALPGKPLTDEVAAAAQLQGEHPEGWYPGSLAAFVRWENDAHLHSDGYSRSLEESGEKTPSLTTRVECLRKVLAQRYEDARFSANHEVELACEALDEWERSLGRERGQRKGIGHLRIGASITERVRDLRSHIESLEANKTESEPAGVKLPELEQRVASWVSRLVAVSHSDSLSDVHTLPFTDQLDLLMESAIVRTRENGLLMSMLKAGLQKDGGLFEYARDFFAGGHLDLVTWETELGLDTEVPPNTSLSKRVMALLEKLSDTLNPIYAQLAAWEKEMALATPEVWQLSDIANRLGRLRYSRRHSKLHGATERDLAVALSKQFPSYLSEEVVESPTQRVGHEGCKTVKKVTLLLIDLPTGQVGWDVDGSHPRYSHLKVRPGKHYDGHTVDEKIARLAALQPNWLGSGSRRMARYPRGRTRSIARNNRNALRATRRLLHEREQSLRALQQERRQIMEAFRPVRAALVGLPLGKLSESAPLVEMVNVVAGWVQHQLRAGS